MELDDYKLGVYIDLLVGGPERFAVIITREEYLSLVNGTNGVPHTHNELRIYYKSCDGASSFCFCHGSDYNPKVVSIEDVDRGLRGLVDKAYLDVIVPVRRQLTFFGLDKK